MATTCPKCSTPLDDAGSCVTCAAEREGLQLLSRNDYAQVREMLTLLEDGGLAAEMERVPPARAEERHHPRWNLYVPKAEAEAAVSFLSRDWAALLADPEARTAAERGARSVDLDQGGEIECPACGHRFAATAAQADCPDCGLSLGVAEGHAAGEPDR